MSKGSIRLGFAPLPTDPDIEVVATIVVKASELREWSSEYWLQTKLGDAFKDLLLDRDEVYDLLKEL